MTGGNIDTTILGRTIERGLAVDGRLIKFDVVVSDRPGGKAICKRSAFKQSNLGIAELTALISKCGASIKDIFHERAWLAANVFSVRVRVVAETRDRAHVKELYDQLKAKYSIVSFPEELIRNEMKYMNIGRNDRANSYVRNKCIDFPTGIIEEQRNFA